MYIYILHISAASRCTKIKLLLKRGHNFSSHTNHMLGYIVFYPSLRPCVMHVFIWIALSFLNVFLWNFGTIIVKACMEFIHSVVHSDIVRMCRILRARSLRFFNFHIFFLFQFSNISDNVTRKIIDCHMAALSRLSYNGASIHFTKSPSDLCSIDPEAIIEEMKIHLPFLFELLDAMISDTSGSKKGTIAMIYGMIMHSRNKQASLMQRLISTLLMKSGANNMVNILHKIIWNYLNKNRNQEYFMETQYKPKGIQSFLQSLSYQLVP